MNMRWWQQAIIYQIYPKSFYDTDGDGIGDLRGVMEKLEYLEFLGIDMIWLCPIYPSPMDDNGYDISDYCDISDTFGSLEEFDVLVAEAKKRGIKIMMDLVINHTSDEHTWFQESKSSKSSGKRDWYIWQEPKSDGAPPNNWRSIFGGSAWELDPTTNQYYLHTFSKKQPDLNWENENVRQELFRIVNWWVEKGVDGFRVDAITFIKKGSFTDNLPSKDSDGLSLISHANLNHPGIGNFLKELKDRTFANYDIVTVAEAPGVSHEEMPHYIGESGYFDMLFEFHHVDLDVGPDGKWFEPKAWTLHDLKRAISDSQELLNQTGWGALYIENHDQPRSINKFLGEVAIENRAKAAKMLATFYFLLKGTPFIYQGQELGMTNVSYESIDDYDDLASIDQYNLAMKEGHSQDVALQAIWRRSRDNSRTPMQWNCKPNAGFTEGTPWLPLHPDYQTVNVEEAMNNEESILHYYRKLIALRKSGEYHEIVVNGNYVPILMEDNAIFAYKRIYNGRKIIVLVNFTNVDAPIKNIHLEGKVILSNYVPASRVIEKLRPYEAVVLEG